MSEEEVAELAAIAVEKYHDLPILELEQALAKEVREKAENCKSAEDLDQAKATFKTCLESVSNSLLGDYLTWLIDEVNGRLRSAREELIRLIDAEITRKELDSTNNTETRSISDELLERQCSVNERSCKVSSVPAQV